MANLNVTYTEMKDTARKLRDGRTEIEGQLQQLKSRVDTLVAEGGYTTDASSPAFEASYTEFNDGVKKTIEGLEGMGGYLDAAADAMQQTDEELAKSASQ